MTNWLFGINSLALLVQVCAGLMFRWSFPGRVCSGDFVLEGNTVELETGPYAKSGGTFIKWYVLGTIGVIGLTGCFVTLGAISLTYNVMN